jgi:hypothetical protein
MAVHIRVSVVGEDHVRTLPKALKDAKPAFDIEDCRSYCRADSNANECICGY